MNINDISDRYVEGIAVLDPILATESGITGHDAEMTDYSPDGSAARAELTAGTLRDLAAAVPSDDRERVARDVMIERLEVEQQLDAAREQLRAVRIIASPIDEVRGAFDLMSRETGDDWRTIAMRMALVPDGIAGYVASLREGVRHGLVAARHQAVQCAHQAGTWGGVGTDAAAFFPTLVTEYDASGGDDPALRRDLVTAAEAATGAYAALAGFLREEYAPRAAERDAVGADRYGLFARAFTGIDLDLEETYAWGWEELHRIQDAMDAVCERILPGASAREVMDHLDAQPDQIIDGVDEFRAWLQQLMDRTISDLDGVHFDIAPPIRQVEAMIAPPGGSAAMYYTGPAEDFSRPGRTWYPTLGKTSFPIWGEVSTAYHEGVPGHHLQIAQTVFLRDTLTRFQRLLALSSGYAEGWALYAERLMGELGYLEDPAYELGMLRAQALRAARVVVDIGMHLELPIPAAESYHPGEVWNGALAHPFLVEHTAYPADMLASEVDRYLGWPGQAISYKVGERAWLATRAEAKRRAGAAFDLKEFHRRALDLGPMSLTQLPLEFAR